MNTQAILDEFEKVWGGDDEDYKHFLEFVTAQEGESDVERLKEYILNRANDHDAWWLENWVEAIIEEWSKLPTPPKDDYEGANRELDNLKLSNKEGE